MKEFCRKGTKDVMIEVEYGLPIAKKYCEFPVALLETTSCLPDLSSAIFKEMKSEYLFCVIRLVWQDKNLKAFFNFAENTSWSYVQDFFDPALDFNKSY